MNKEFKEQWCNFIIYLENELLGRRLVKYEYDLVEYSFKEGFKRATK